MTVADNTSRNQYTATSGQTVFAYTFEIVDKDHIVVLQNGTALSEGTDYTVSNVGNDNGGNITLTSGATAGDVMTLYREMPYSRTQNYTNSGDFLASEVNADFDELWLAGEQTDRSFSQSIRKPITDSDSISMELPEAATRANKFVKFDATGAVDVAGATVTVSAEDVSIDDAGNYYTSDNVEGALQEVGASLDTKLENVVEDTTPQLGGNLDVNGNDITGTGNIDLTGNLDVSGTATVGAVTYTGTDGTDGQVLMTDGAGNASFEDMPSSTYLDVKDFGATGNGVDDDTTAIQNAINHASTRGIQTIFFPEGHYKYTTLRFYHDQTDNTAFQGTNLFVGDSTNGTDGTATFAFGWYIADASDLTVTVEGTEQILDTDYTVSGVGSDTGGTITFTAGNVPLAPVGSTVTNRKGDGQTLEFFYSGTVIPDASNVSVTVDGVASTQFTVDIGKRLVVFNAGHEPPAPANPDDNNVVITIQKTVNISSNNRDGRVQLRGTGRLAIADLVGLDKNRTRLYGSVLESTGDGIIIDTDQEFSTPVDARNFVAKDLTFLADNTGQIIKAEKNPGMSFDTCSFKQFNPAGTGLEVRNCWFFTMNQCYVVGQRHIDTFTAVADGSTLEQFTYTFDNPSATSDILVQFNGGALTETTDYTVTMGATKTVTLTATGATKIGAEYTLSGNRTINVQRINTGSGVSSQFVGRSFGNFAGLWTITQSLVDSFANGVHWTGGTVTNFSIRDTAVQNCGNYNIYADSGVIQQMLLDNVYMENQKTQGVSFIKGDGTAPPDNSAVIRNLRMTNCFMLGGGTNPRITGTCIDLDNVDAIDIEGMYVFRVRQPFLNVTRTKNLTNVPGEIKNSIFASDSGQTKFLDLEPTVYLLSGVLPNVHNCIWPGFENGFYNTTNNILLFDSTVDSNFLRQYTDLEGTTGIAKFGFGDTVVKTGLNKVDTSPYTITGGNGRTYHDLEHALAGGLKVILPDTQETNDGRLIIVKNNEASTSASQFPYINVVNNSDQNTTIGRLSPGQAGLFIYDAQETTKFKYVGRAFTDDLELTDDHKITFGRGTSAGPDMEIYHDSTSGESRIDTLAGLTLDGLTYPTADGTSGQSIITDGAGNLTFGTAAGTGITAVVEDTTPQLGGDLDLNGSDITGTGNLDFTGTINTVLSVDGTTEDVFITGATPALEFVENDSGGSRMRMAWNTSGSFSPTLYQSLYGDSTTTYGGINIQTRASDGSGNQVVYAYDPINDRNWWGTRASGDVLMQLQSDGTFNVRGGDVSFENAAATSDDFYWDASTSRLGLGTTSPAYDLEIEGASREFRITDTGANGTYASVATFPNSAQFKVARQGANLSDASLVAKGNGSYLALNNLVDRTAIIESDGNGDLSISIDDGTTDTEFMRFDYSSGNIGIGTTTPSYDLSVVGSSAAIQVDNTAGSPDQTLMIFQADMGTNDRNFQIKSPATDSLSDPFRFTTANSFAFEIDANDSAFVIDANANVGIGTSSPSSVLHAKDTSAIVRSEGTGGFGSFYAIGSGTFSSHLFMGNGGGEKGRITTNDSGAITFSNTTSVTERMRIDSSGNLLVGTTDTSLHNATSGSGFTTNATSGFVTSARAGLGSAIICNKTGQTTAQATDYIEFRNQGTAVGEITYDGTDVSLAQVSDARLKQNVADAEDTGGIIDAIQVRSFDWVNDARQSKRFGFVAQELHSAFPEAVKEGGKNPEDNPWTINEAKLIPVLLKEIQSLRARVAQLEND